MNRAPTLAQLLAHQRLLILYRKRVMKKCGPLARPSLAAKLHLDEAILAKLQSVETRP